MSGSKSRTLLTLQFFFDGACPLCTKEVRLLQRWDEHNAIRFVDLTSESEMERFPSIDVNDAMESLYVINSDGTTYRGIDATYVAWAAVGKGFWVKPIQWPWFRPVAKLGYRVFARYRHGIALVLTGKARNDRCDSTTVDTCRNIISRRNNVDDTINL